MVRLVALLCALSVGSSSCAGQLDAPSGRTRWDAGHHILYYGFGALNRGGLTIQSYVPDSGRQREIDVLASFPGARRATVLDVGSGPNKTTVVSVILGYESVTRRYLLLFYDAAGTLRSVWNTAPYSVVAVASAGDGRMFVLQKRTDSASGVSSYPLLRVYDSDGNVIDAFLSSRIFRQGGHALDPNSAAPRGEPRMMLRDEKVYVYAPFTREVIICTSGGALIRRRELTRSVQIIAGDEKVGFLGINQLAFVDDQHVLLELGNDSLSADTDLARRLYLLDILSGSYRVITRTPGAKLLASENDKALLLNPAASEVPSILSINLASK